MFKGTVLKKTKKILLGGAFGDAWGRDTQPLSYPQILNLENGTPFTTHPRVTDNIILSYASIQAIIDSVGHIKDDNTIKEALRTRFNDYVKTTPGTKQTVTEQTTYVLFKKRSKNIPVKLLTDNHTSMNMRTIWLGALPYDDDTITRLALLNTQTTHNHPLVLAVSAVAPLYLKHIKQSLIEFNEGEPAGLQYLIALVDTMTHKYVNHANKNFTQGLMFLQKYLTNITPSYAEALQQEQEDIGDLATILHGNGTTVENIFLTAVLAVEKFYNEPTDALYYTARTSGRSATTAFLTGSLMGATDNLEWPDWQHNFAPSAQTKLKTLTKNINKINPKKEPK